MLLHSICFCFLFSFLFVLSLFPLLNATPTRARGIAYLLLEINSNCLLHVVCLLVMGHARRGPEKEDRCLLSNLMPLVVGLVFLFAATGGV